MNSVEDIAAKVKPAVRGRSTFCSTEAQDDPEDGALKRKLRGPGAGPVMLNLHV